MSAIAKDALLICLLALTALMLEPAHTLSSAAFAALALIGIYCLGGDHFASVRAARLSRRQHLAARIYLLVERRRDRKRGF